MIFPIHLLRTVYYEYPDIPCPPSDLFMLLQQIASSHTYDQHDGEYRGGSGIVIGLWREELEEWIESNYNRLSMECQDVLRKQIDEVESPCEICKAEKERTGNARPIYP